MEQSPLLRHTELVIWFLLTDISRLFRQLVDEETSQLHLPRAHWYMLAHIYHWNGLNQRELAKLMDISKSSAARMAQELEEKGWIRRKVDDRDKRAWNVALAPGMAPIVRDLSELARVSFMHSFTALNRKKTDLLIALLREVENGLEKQKSTKSEAALNTLRESITSRLRNRQITAKKARRSAPAPAPAHKK